MSRAFVKEDSDGAAPRYPLPSRDDAGFSLAAARALFIDRGYVATTIDAIADRADVSPETVYSTFGNKRSLLSALVDNTVGHQVSTKQASVVAAQSA